MLLDQIQEQDQALAAQLSEHYYANQLELVMKELEAKNYSSNESRVYNWLRKA